MKKLFLILFAFWVLLFPNIALAQQQTNSNTVNTKVGNPKTFSGGSAPPPPLDIKQGLIDKFGITFNGFDNTHLGWIWEKLWEVSNTDYDNLLRGAVVENIGSSGISQQVGCFSGGTSLELASYVPEDFFKFILTHELGHVIEACNTQSKTHVLEQHAAFDSEGGISAYARDTSRCFPGWNNNYNEDFADMLAYYLNPSAGFQSGPSSCGNPANPPNPYLNGFSQHHTVADKILGGV